MKHMGVKRCRRKKLKAIVQYEGKLEYLTKTLSPIYNSERSKGEASDSPGRAGRFDHHRLGKNRLARPSRGRPRGQRGRLPRQLLRRGAVGGLLLRTHFRLLHGNRKLLLGGSSILSAFVPDGKPGLQQDFRIGFQPF